MTNVKPKRDQKQSQDDFRRLMQNIEIDDDDEAAIKRRIADTEALPDDGDDDDEIVEADAEQTKS